MIEISPISITGAVLEGTSKEENYLKRSRGLHGGQGKPLAGAIFKYPLIYTVTL